MVIIILLGSLFISYVLGYFLLIKIVVVRLEERSFRVRQKEEIEEKRVEKNQPPALLHFCIYMYMGYMTKRPLLSDAYSYTPYIP